MPGPKAKEIEINIFGPGYGEGSVIHVGSNIWIIIDSCIDTASKEPVTLSYLRSIGVNPEESVRLIIATHCRLRAFYGLGTTDRLTVNRTC